MSALKDIRLFTTQSHPCSYLPDQQAKTLFVDPELRVGKELHSTLSDMGFRRSGSHFYKPHCESCNSCVPCRIAVDGFAPNKRFRRILKRNADLSVEAVSSINSREYYELYAHYINNRHRDGDMYPASREQYYSFLVSCCDSTRFYAVREEGGRLVAVIVSDLLNDALSAVYTFYDVEATRQRSLGNFAILWQLGEARRQGLSWLYLGYWIKNCEKMNYKSQFRPLQMLLNGRWIQVN